MRSTRKAFHVAWPVVATAVVVLSCGSPTEGCGCTPAQSPAGSWIATEFGLTPAGRGTIDVLAAGGSLTIVITTNLATSGILNVPANINGGVPLSASMAGTASFNGIASEVTFTQAADTFVRDLTWQYSGNALSVTNQVAGSASFTITLHRQ